MQILDNIIDRSGDWNPQVFRELKERLTSRNIGITATLSLFIQGAVWFGYNSQIQLSEKTNPYTNETSGDYNNRIHSRYCTEYLKDNYSDVCKFDSSGNFLNPNWQLWHSDVFICLGWILSIGLILGSVYLLVADLVQEEKRGTLNFIRLSPQSAQTVFIGKILGVPSLVYLAAASMLPFHLFVGIAAGASIPLIAGWYLAIGSMWWLLSSGAVLYVLLGGIQPILTIIAVAYPTALPVFLINQFAAVTINHQPWRGEFDRVVQWFWLPVGGNVLLLYGFGIGCCLVMSYGIWQALERRYLNPTDTVMSKSQSYIANLCFQVWIAGFALPLMPQRSYDTKAALVILAGLDFLALCLLIPLLLPSKQALQDWSRYRRERVNHQQRKFWQRELVQDLMRNDKSPALLSIAINIGIALVLWVPASLISFSPISHGVRFIAGLCLGASLILIYATIAHWSRFINFKKRNLWTLAIVGGVMFLPSVFAFIISPSSSPTGIAAILLLFSPFAPVGILQLSGGTILATFAAQLLILAGLTRQLQQRLQITGQSQSKELLANN
ncbi:MAG: hypothetical protein RLZZ135_892 [Cyanobacteriota bacterium]|jgi:hypothetical protein